MYCRLVNIITVNREDGDIPMYTTGGGWLSWSAMAVGVPTDDLFPRLVVVVDHLDLNLA